jgi:hypothetical protein
MIRYTKDLIPSGFSRDGLGDLLDTTEVSLRGTTNRSARIIFDELEYFIDIYRDFHMNALLEPLDEEGQDELNVAKELFNNPTGLPDGGVIYGILINAFGMDQNSDQDYLGNYFVESRDIHLDNVHIKGKRPPPRPPPVAAPLC